MPSADIENLADLLRPAMGLKSNYKCLQVGQQTLTYAHRRHRTACLLHYYLRSDSDVNVAFEEGTAGWLDQHFKSNLLKEARQKQVWQHISGLLLANGFDVWGLKGIGIAEALYPFPGSRLSKDIDVLVSPEQASAAANLLLENGYRRGRNRKTESSSAFLFRAGFSKDLLLIDPQFGQAIEFHRRLFYAEPRGFSDFIRSSTEVASYCSVLSEAGMLYTIIHGALDYWSRLKWLVDLSLLVRNMDSKKFTALMALGEKYGCASAVIASLQWCETIFPGSLTLETQSEVEKVLKSRPEASELIRKFAWMLESSHDYENRNLWQRPDFPTPAWHIFPTPAMRAWLSAYVPASFVIRKIT